MVSVVLCGGEIVRVFAPTATRKAWDLYHSLFRAGMRRDVAVVEAWMGWEYFVSPPVEAETVWMTVTPNGRKFYLHRTLQQAECFAESEYAPKGLTIRSVTMEW
jgi:hypothetical protein